jgi:hypothetical protein
LGNLSENRVILLFTLDFAAPLFSEFATALFAPQGLQIARSQTSTEAPQGNGLGSNGEAGR